MKKLLIVVICLAAVLAVLCPGFAVHADEYVDDTAATAGTSYGYGSYAYPDWYKPGFTPQDVFHNDPSVPRLVDTADIFSDTEENSLAALLASMKAEFNMDFLVVTDNSDYGLGTDMYAAEYYDMNGYGVGSNYSGVVMFISMEPGNRSWWTAGTGNAESYFTSSNVNHMDDVMEPYMIRGEYAKGVTKCFEELTVLLRNGKFPKTAGQYIRTGIFAVLAGALAGLVSLVAAKGTMRSVSTATTAGTYLNSDSLRIMKSNDVFIDTNVTRTLIETSSSRSSGGSSYSGGYHSSGGHSFSGGGRHF